MFVFQAFGALLLPIEVVLATAIPETVCCDAEEGQLVFEGGNTLLARVVDLARPVEGQYVAEDVRIAVEEILAGFVVVEKILFV